MSSISKQSHKYASDQEESDSEYSFALSHGDPKGQSDEEPMKEEKPLVVIEEDIRESLNSKYSNFISFKQPTTAKKEEKNEMIDEGLRGSQQSYNNSVEDILRDKGALEYG